MNSDIYDFKFLARIGLMNAASRYFKRLCDNATGYRQTYGEHFEELGFWAGSAKQW